MTLHVLHPDHLPAQVHPAPEAAGRGRGLQVGDDAGAVRVVLYIYIYIYIYIDIYCLHFSICAQGPC